MVADRTGLRVSTTTIKWLNLVVVVLPFVIGGVSYWTAIAVARAEVSGRFDLDEQRIKANEADLLEIKARLDRTLDRIDLRLQSIEQGLAKLQGSLRTSGRILDPTTLATDYRGTP